MHDQTELLSLAEHLKTISITNKTKEHPCHPHYTLAKQNRTSRLMKQPTVANTNCTTNIPTNSNIVTLADIRTNKKIAHTTIITKHLIREITTTYCKHFHPTSAAPCTRFIPMAQQINSTS